MAYPNLVADFNDSEGSLYPAELYAGEADVITQPWQAGAAISQFQVCMLNSSGEMIPWDGTATVGDGAATVVPTASAIAALAVASGDTGPFFVAGAFNGDLVTGLLIWPGSTHADTLVKRKRAFVGTNIIIGAPKGAQTRMAIP